MKSKVWKLLAVAMAAALIACAGAGCGNKDNKSQQSSTTSAASTTESAASAEESKKEESKAEESKKEESKTEESKTEESKTEESKTEESSEEPSEESEEESEQESEEESEEESPAATEITAADVAGCYEYGTGDQYIGFILSDDGNLNYRTSNGYTMNGKWALEGTKVTMHIAGGAQSVEYQDGKLVDDSGSELTAVESLSVEDNTDNIVLQAATSGTWYRSTDDGVNVSFTLNEDGTGSYIAGAQEFTATWEVSDGGLTIYVEGGAERLIFGISADESIKFVDPEGTYSFSKYTGEE